jgi:hypothetical protein
MVGLASGRLALERAAHRVLAGNTPLWLLAAAGVGVLAWRRGPRAAFLGGWLLASAAAVSAGFFFREHYFVQLLPVAAALAGVAVAGPFPDEARGVRWRRVASVVAAAAVAAAMWHQRNYLFRTDPKTISNAVYRGNYFSQLESVAREIGRRSSPEDQIVVLGSEAQVYAYARRRSASPYIYTYAMMEESPFAERFQKEFIADVERAKPRFVVAVHNGLSWLARPRSVRTVLDWAGSYVGSNHRLVGIVRNSGEVLWDDPARAAAGQPDKLALAVYERN